jgi:hypothetical protein
MKKSDECRFMLQALGLQFVRVEPAQGWYRSNPYSEAYRWEWSGVLNNRPLYGGCYTTMTECAKRRRLKFNERMDEVAPA